MENPVDHSVGTRSQMSSPKNDLMDQGKKLFKNGEFKEALKVFEKGQ